MLSRVFHFLEMFIILDSTCPVWYRIHSIVNGGPSLNRENKQMTSIKLVKPWKRYWKRYLLNYTELSKLRSVWLCKFLSAVLRNNWRKVWWTDWIATFSSLQIRRHNVCQTHYVKATITRGVKFNYFSQTAARNNICGSLVCFSQSDCSLSLLNSCSYNLFSICWTFIIDYRLASYHSRVIFVSHIIFGTPVL